MPILRQLLTSENIDDQRKQLERFRKLIGPLIMLAEPLPANAIIKLLQTSNECFHSVVKWLHSVFNMPKGEDAPIKLFHLSFRDFLTDRTSLGSGPFWIDESIAHQDIAAKCLQLLSAPGNLKRDICTCSNPGVYRKSVKKAQIDAAISVELAYACRYWVSHLGHSQRGLMDKDLVHNFLNAHFLHWLEVLSWLGSLSSAIFSMSVLRSCLNASHAMIIRSRIGV